MITQDAQFTAIFREIDPTKQQYLVQISSKDETQGTVTAFDGMIAEGTTLEITATPNEGYEFVSWSDSVKTNPRQIVVNQAITIYPIFALKKVTLKIDAAFGGTVNSDEANGIYNYGEMVAIKATPNERYHFLSWSDGNRLAERTIKLTKDTFLTATFEQNTYYALNLSAENGGKILATGETEWKQRTLLYFDPSQRVIIKAKADEGYIFYQWSDGVTDSDRTLFLNKDTAITALFKPVYKLTVNINLGGDVEVAGNYIAREADTYYFAAGEKVTLTAKPNEGFMFSNWENSENNRVREITMNQNLAVTAVFKDATAVPTRTVSIATSGDGFGIVSPVNSAYYVGESFTVTATPNAGSIFVAWSDGVTANPRTVLVGDKDIAFDAIFSLISYKLTVSVEGVGGTVNDSVNTKTYHYGDIVKIEAKPDPNYHFLNWSDGVKLPYRNLVITQDTVIKAFFEQNTYYALNLSAENGGKIFATGETEWKQRTLLYFDPSQRVIIKAKADEGYIFYQWSDGVTDSDRTLFLNKDTAITALFKPVYKLTVNINLGGDVEVAGNYIAREADTYYFAAGEKVTLTAKPNEGFMFSNWENSENNRVREITMNQNLAVTAVFKDATAVPTRTVSIATSGDGFGIVSPVNSAYYVGESFTVTATPNAGSIFVAWSDGVTANPRTVLVGDKDIAFDAIFSLISYKLTVSVEGVGGTVNDSVNTKTYHYGDIVKIEAKPDPNYHFLKWSDAFSSPYRNLVITQDTVIKAFFEGDLFTITFVNYNDSVIESKQFPYGAMPSCSVTPTKPADSKKEYVFAGWQPQLAPVTGDATYKAVFSEKIAAYTVTFYDWNYEEIDVQKVKPGEAAVMPEDPTRKGYEFTGWKMDTDGATMADLKNVQSDLDVVATYKRADQGIDQITNDLSPMVNKICIDGQIYILRDNKLYTLTGQKVK